MATAVVARPVARPQARARDEEVLVWPDLVFVEFIAAMVFTITLFLLSFLVNAPLLDQANADAEAERFFLEATTHDKAASALWRNVATARRESGNSEPYYKTA